MRSISRKRLLIEEEDHECAARVSWCWRFLDSLLRIGCVKSRGLRNALNVRVEDVELIFSGLPKGFNDVRILLVTDLHLDGTDALAQRLMSVIDELDYDYCILGGDYSDSRNGDCSQAYSQIKQIAAMLREKSRVFGILGNYDRYSIAEVLDDCGAEMLINEGICLERNGDKIYLAGLDDGSHYQADDFALADSTAWEGAFKVMVSHSPAKYKAAAQAGYSLYLTGDTHGGQICLPGGRVLFCGPTTSRKMAKGKWEYVGMVGYTSRGVGTSRIKVRYFCPPEITMITLKNSEQ